MTGAGLMQSNIEEGRTRLRRVLGYRALALVVILAASTYFFYPSFIAFERQCFIAATVSAFFLLLLEWLLIRSTLSFGVQLFTYFGLDLLLVGTLVVLTGGIQSPFVFLFGLLIVAVGTQSHVLVVLLVTVVACICYLFAIHTSAYISASTLSAAETLHILLQTSALFLVGGVMAAIARRYANLQQESHQAVRQHRQLKELYAQVVSSMQEGIVILDEELHVQDSNVPAYQLLGRGGEPAWFRLDDIGNVPSSLLDFLKSGDTSLFQCEWKTASGSCLTTVAPLQGDDPAARWLLTIVDITDVRTLERRLAEQDKLASMGRMVAMLAHEIRNPLQTIGQSVELMRSVSEARQVDIQRIVSEEIQRLNRLVSDMLDFVQPLTPVPVEVTCSDLIGSSVVQVDMPGARKISWDSDIDSLFIDPDHFRLVLDNLLRNAVEASGQPETVEIRLQMVGKYWQLSVSDQGGGITPEMKEHLFEPFATGRETGVGLGLATVWQVCQVNGWKAEVEDVPGGSCFMVRGYMGSKQADEVLHG